MKQSTHERFEARVPVKAGSARAFGFVFTAVFVVVGLWPLIGHDAPRWWALAVGAAFLVVSLVRPALLQPLNRLWFRFGMLLHHVVNPLVMGFLFYLVVTPTALIVRALGKDSLRLRFDPEAETYWERREPPGPAVERMSNQF